MRTGSPAAPLTCCTPPPKPSRPSPIAPTASVCISSRPRQYNCATPTAPKHVSTSDHTSRTTHDRQRTASAPAAAATLHPGPSADWVTRGLTVWQSPTAQSGFRSGGAIRTLTPPPLFFVYYGIHSLMFGGYPPTAIGYPPTAIGYPPTAIGYPPTAIGYPPTAIGYPPAAIVGRIGHFEFFFSSLRHPLFQIERILTTCQIRYHSHCGIIIALDSSEP